MSDFKSKIKNYNAMPSENAWDNLLIKKEQQSLSRLKKFLLAFLVFNVLVLAAALAMLFRNNDSPVRSSSNDKISTLITESDNNKSLLLIQCDSINHNLVEQIKHLQNELEKYKNRDSLLLSKKKALITKIPVSGSNSTSNYASQNKIIQVTSVSGDSSNPINPVPTKILEDTKEINAQPFVIIPWLQNDRTQTIYNYIINLLDAKPTPKLSVSTITQHDENEPKWQASIGYGIAEDIYGNQGNHFTVSIQKPLNNNLELGLRFGHSKTIENNVYRVYENIKDHELEFSNYLFVRYTPIKIKGFNLHADAGIGYSYITRSFRNNRSQENQVIYYDASRSFGDLSYALSFGTMYKLNENLKLGLLYSVYRSEQESLSLNLNIKL